MLGPEWDLTDDLQYGDYKSINNAEVTIFTDHLDTEDAVASRLERFEVVYAMRERTPFPRSLLAVRLCVDT